MRIWITALLLFCAATALGGDFPAACEALTDGRAVRLELRDGRLVEGGVAGWDGFHLAVVEDGRVESFAAVDVAALWVRHRHTGSGAKVGAAIGGGGGAGLFTLMALVLNSMDDDSVSVPGALLVGGLLGAGAGALVGATVGSSFPDWELLYGVGTDQSERPSRAGPAADRRSGGLDVGLGIAWTDGQDDPGLSYRLGLTTSALRRFELELLLASHRLGPARQQNDPPDWLPAPEPRGVTSVWQAGAELRLPLVSGPVRPYPALGLAGYGWQDTFLGLSWGGGLDVDFSGRWTGRLDYRHHSSIQNLTETDPEFETLTAGLTLAW